MDMPTFISPQHSQKILVVGPIYDKVEKLAKVEALLSNYDWIVFNGGLDLSLIEKMNQLTQTGKIIYVLGRSDYLSANQHPEKLSNWIKRHSNLLCLNFPSRNVLIMDGGLPVDWATINLTENLEISFISHVQDKPWHHFYNGGLGYVISNNPLTQKLPHYYKHSMQLGNLLAGEVYGIEIDEIGLKPIILL